MSRIGPWGSAEGSGREGLHIADVDVALDGALVGHGVLLHHADDEGHFAALAAERVRISRGFGGMRIARCHASRDGSGFLRTETFGSELLLPDSIAAMIEHALWAGVRVPVSAKFAHQTGILADTICMDRRRTQPLSDWTIDIEENDGHVAVKLSAALHALHLAGWDKDASNYWSVQDGARVEVRFAINPATRVACFGSHGLPLPGAAAMPATLVDPSPLSALNIANAPVGAGTQLGLGEGRWFNFYEAKGLSYLSITECSQPSRTASGFLTFDNPPRWPRITINGLTMDSIWFAVKNSPTIRLSAEGDAVGSLEYPGSGGWIDKITAVDTEITLNDSGLHFAVEVRSPKIRSVCFRLPWELLVLRYPKFIPRRPVSDPGFRPLSQSRPAPARGRG